jgi:UDP-N-acetyl-D-glucosamine dehydrogenase
VATGLEVGTDFHLAFSPERVDPGRTDWTAKTTPKMVGGVTDGGRAAACTLYERAMDKVIAVSSPEAAELSKLLENIFRSVNIALVNELDDDSAERARLVVDFRNPTGENGSLNGRVWKL